MPLRRLPHVTPAAGMVAAVMLAAGLSGPLAAEPPAGLMQGWQLANIGGAAPAAHATLDLREPGRAVGQAPCNRWFATLILTEAGDAATGLHFGQIGATRMACADLAAEQAFFAALAGVTMALLQDGQLILTGADGLLMEFRPDTP